MDGIPVGGDRGQVVDHPHEGVDLLLGAAARGLDRWRLEERDLPAERLPVGYEDVEGLGDRVVAGVVLLGRHPPLGGGDVVVQLGLPGSEEHERQGLLGLGLGGGCGPRLLQEPGADRFPTAGLLHQLHHGVEQHGGTGIGVDPVVVAFGAVGVHRGLALRADRTHILLFGATSCGPFRERAPSIEKFTEAVAGRDRAPIVHHLSIDDDPDSFDAALAAYPSGICTDAFEEDFVVDAVPKHYVVREGRVVEQGVVSEEGIAAWREHYAP